jgi:anti-anti-sigma factor
MTLNLSIEQYNGVHILTLAGRLVYGPEADLVRGICQTLLKDSPLLAIDLHALTALDSAGVGTLARAVASARMRTRDICLVCPSAKANEVLQLTRLLPLFRVVEDKSQIGSLVTQRPHAQSA